MTVEEINKLRFSNEAPFNHQEFAIWLHNKIIDKINYELFDFREQAPFNIERYKTCNEIMKNFGSLKPIKP